MKKLRRILVGLAFASILGDGVLHAQAPDARTVAQIYDDGMKAFESGDFKTTLENLEKVIVQAAPDAQLESVFYTLGAAYFNLPDYPKAIIAFQIYQTKYPKAARFNEGSLAIGQALSLSEKFTEAAVHYQTLENVPELREQALALEAAAYEKAGDNEKALGLCDLDEKGRDPHAVELSGHKVTPLLEQRSRAAAASVATKGISLIRNRSGLVPLRIDKTKSTFFIRQLTRSVSGKTH